MKSKEGRKRKTAGLHVNRQIIRYRRPGVNRLLDKQGTEWRVTGLCVGGVNAYVIMGNDMLKAKSCGDWEWPRLWAPQTGECTYSVYRSVSRWDKAAPNWRQCFQMSFSDCHDLVFVSTPTVAIWKQSELGHMPVWMWTESPIMTLPQRTCALLQFDRALKQIPTHCLDFQSSSFSV